MTASVDAPHDYRDRLVDQLARRGVLEDPAWRDAFGTVPREVFVSRFTVPSPDGEHRTYDLADPAGRDAALAAVYSDNPLITQKDAGGTATSSSTLPSLMAIMLDALQIADGMKVLEIGAGTGYNAALLAHRLGDGAVTTVDFHPGLVAAAKQALGRAGYRPTVVCADGAGGYRERAPYDRLIATCGVPRVPVPWLEQVRPGGLLVVNVGFGLARLTRHADGSAEGKFLDYASFMNLRGDVTEEAPTARDVLKRTKGVGAHRIAPFPDVLDERPVVFLRSVIMPGVQQIVVEHDDGPHYVLFDPISGSWARVRQDGERQAKVTEKGPRRLWDELVALTEQWTALGRLPVTSYGLTVGPEGTHVLRHETGWQLELPE